MKRWSEMTAREKDALVAERCMGWHAYKDPKPGATEQYPDRQCSVCHSAYGHGVKPYSTDIAAAWEVVEKIGLVSLTNGPEGWLCRFGVISGKTIIEIDGRGDTAPEAICLAALRAVGVEVAG